MPAADFIAKMTWRATAIEVKANKCGVVSVSSVGKGADRQGEVASTSERVGTNPTSCPVLLAAILRVKFDDQ